MKIYLTIKCIVDTRKTFFFFFELLCKYVNMLMFQDNFSISYKRKFLGRESAYYAKTVENLDDEEGIVAQTKESLI